jgi:Mn-dependent DtxR family transcriptional regulator
MHEVEARLSRWLLTSADRTESEELNLTQEFLAQMLGVQRSTVTVAASTLQRAGFISYTRGKIHILDRPNLAKAACECYDIVRESYDRMLRPNEKGNLAYVISPTDGAKANT